jgi:hypothetical protein
MEVSSMKRNQLLKELQSHKKYRNKTQKEIADKLGGVSDFRTELIRLNKKSVKSNVKNIENNKEKTSNTNLPSDAIYEILLRSDLSTTQKLLQTSKSIKNNNDLWKNKIIRDYPFFKFDNQDDIQNVYLLLYKSHQKAKELLLVTQLLALDNDDDDWINIIYTKYENFYLPSLLLENIKKQVTNYKSEEIFLTPKGHDYEIQYIVNDSNKLYESTILIGLNEAIDVLTSLLYFNVNIEDNNNLNLLKTYTTEELSDMRSYKRESYNRRNHMLNILKFLDKL